VTVVFFHAHPDDEAIFTGGTMALLSDRGHRVVVVFATQGELGEEPDDLGPHGDLAALRAVETGRAADVLGIARVEFLGYHDSGMPGGDAGRAAGAFGGCAVDEAVDRLTAIVAGEDAVALVSYDEQGVYGHPDHVRAHEVAVSAAARLGVPALYECTVDREYLHFVETHVVEEAGGIRRDLGLAASGLGLPTVEITTTIDARVVLDRKRAAMAAHASQIPETATALRLPPETFAAVYGYEWYRRRGAPGPLDGL
jgi:LmbE family N-acetylglucosaminyl deacetylase